MRLPVRTRVSVGYRLARAVDLVCLTAALAVGAPAPTATAQETYAYQVLAKPGMPADRPSTFSRASAIGVDAAGRVLVRADDGLLLVHPDGTHTVVAAPGRPVPGGGNFAAIGAASMSGMGQIAFAATITADASGSSSQALLRFADDRGELEVVLREGDTAPRGGLFRFFGFPAVNNHGDIAFVGSGPTTVPMVSHYGIYLWANGGVTEIFHRDPVAAGWNPYREVFSVKLNDAGQVAFTTASDRDDPSFTLNITSGGQFSTIVAPSGAAPGGGVFNGFLSASLNNHGDIAFAASGGTYGSGIYLWSGGELTVVSHARDEALGLPGSSFNRFQQAYIDDSRQIAFDVVTGSMSAIYLWQAGAIRRIVAAGDVTGSSALASVAGAALNSSGALVFTGRTSSLVESAYLASTEGTIRRIAGRGDPTAIAPTFTSATTNAVEGSGGAFIGSTFPGGRAAFNTSGIVQLWEGFVAPSGDVVVSIVRVSAVSHGGVAATVLLESGVTALWVVRGRDVTEIARVEDQSDGSPFSSIGPLHVNATNDAVFVGWAGSTSSMVFVRDGQAIVIARSGDSAPGGGSFLTFAAMALSDIGEVAFIASDTVASRQRLWLWRDGQLLQLAQRDDPVPGGGTFTTFGTLSRDVAINSGGQVVFTASVSGGASGIFVAAGGAILRAAGDGQVIPDVGTLVFPSYPSIGSDGAVAFRAGLRHANGQVMRSAVFLRRDNRIALVAGPGILQDEIGPVTAFDWPLMSATGEVMFSGETADGRRAVFLASRRAGDSDPPAGARDVGDVGLSGSTQVDGSTVVVRGSGADIWRTSDAFHWNYTTVSGDFDIIARVASVEHVHEWTKAGLMIRQDLSPESAHMFVFATPTAANGVAFQRRLTAGASTVHTWGPSVTSPVYLKLSRRGDSVSAWYRLAPVHPWTFIGIDYSQAFSPTVLVGEAVTSHRHGVAATATFNLVSVTPATAFPSVDVGPVAVPGSSALAPGLFTLHGSGADIWGTSDAFHWLPTQTTGDFDAVVQVTSLEQVHEWTKAGLMIRADGDPSAAQMSLFATGSSGVAFQRRTSPGGRSTHSPGPLSSTPVWLRLSRRGNRFIASYRLARTDAWTLIDSDSSDTFGPTVLLGLAVTSHQDGTLATATFTELSVLPAPAFSSSDIGTIPVPGITDDDGVRTRLSNAGRDIWGTSDAFRYQHTSWTGNAEIIARVLSLDPTDPWAKAGVMIRQSLAPDAPHAMLLFSAAHGLSLQYRAVSGGITLQAANVPGLTTGWVRLVRIGDGVLATYSTDGVTWLALSPPVTVSLGQQVHVGLALTSHNEDAVASAEFDDVSVRANPFGP